MEAYFYAGLWTGQASIYVHIGRDCMDGSMIWVDFGWANPGWAMVHGKVWLMDMVNGYG